MGLFSVILNDVIKNEHIDFTDNSTVKSPYNFLNLAPSILFQSNTPFSLNFIRFVAGEENPFRITFLSPDFSLHTSLSQVEFTKIVLNRPLHQHDTYELMYILKGELYQRIENSRHKYIENSCCLINRNIRHAEEYTSDFHSLNLSLSKNFLSTLMMNGDQDNYFIIEKAPWNSDLSQFIYDEISPDSFSKKEYIDFIPQSGIQDIRNYIYTLLDEVTNIILNPSIGSSLMIKAYIYRIFCYLNNSSYYHTEPIRLGSPAESQLFAQITNLMEKTNGRISRSGISEQLNYSGNYINRIVQKYSGLNTFEYGTSFTMQKAPYLLLNTDKSVSEIIESLGFTDRTHFYRLFHKEYGMTPRSYRMQYRKK